MPRFTADPSAEGVLERALREVLGNIAGRAPAKGECADTVLVQKGLQSLRHD
jgi:hypothetical protein